jgi:LysM repeat protein
MKIRNFAFISLLVLGLTLAACTRQASTAVVPTQPASQPTASVAEDPTMAAVRQTAAVRATEAVAETKAAAAAGAEGTPAATAGAKELPSATPAVVATVAPAVSTPTAVATPVPAVVACPNPYVVKQGDWIYKIARECKMDPAAILAANPGVNANFIVPGQKLNLPSGSAAQPAAQACTGNYTVVKSDTLFNIAYRCGLTTEQLAAANGIRYPFVIHPGDVLKFP